MKLKYYMRGLGTGILFTLFVFVVIIIPNLKLENKINEVNATSEQTGKDGNDVSALVGKNDSSDTPTPTDEIMDTPTPDSETGTPTPSEDRGFPTTDVESTPTADASDTAGAESGEEKLTQQITPTTDVTPTAASTPSPAPTQTPTPTPSPSPTPTSTPSPTPTPTPSPTPAPTKEPTKAPTAAPTPTQKPNPTGKPVPTGTVDESTGKVTITVSKGMLSEGVCQALQKYGIVDNWEALNSYLSRNKLTDKIQTGTFTFTKGMSYEEIGKKLTGKSHN